MQPLHPAAEVFSFSYISRPAEKTTRNNTFELFSNICQTRSFLFGLNQMRAHRKKCVFLCVPKLISKGGQRSKVKHLQLKELVTCSYYGTYRADTW